MKYSFYVLLAALAPSLYAGQYFQDFTGASVGATNFGDGSQFFSSQGSNVAGVVEATLKELALTAYGTMNTRSALLLPVLDTGTVYAFSAKWNSTVYGNFNDAADGFSFNFGPLAGVDLISGIGAQESGYGTGLTFAVQTYSGGNPGFFVIVNGSTIASNTYNPAIQWGINNNAHHFFEVDWHAQLGLSARVDGYPVFSNVRTTNFTPNATNRFVWAARTGSLTEDIRLDNIVVMSGGLLMPSPMGAPFYKSAEYTNANQTADKAFDGTNLTKWLAVATTGFVGATSTKGSAQVRAYALMSAEDIQARDPKSWRLDGSNNGGANWTNLAIGGGYFTNRNERRAWLATNTAAFNAFRLNILTNNGASEIQLAELKLYEFMSIPDDQPFQRWNIPALPVHVFSDAKWADIDNDGDLDFVVAGRLAGGSAESSQIWRNNGGTFSEVVSDGLVNGENAAAAWGDYNNDGYVDLFLGGGIFATEARVYRNNGDGTFTDIGAGMGGFNYGEAQWFDYDNDGDLDIIYAGQLNAGLWRNEGNDVFVQDTGVAVPVTPDSTIEVADYDLDGDDDFAFAGTGTPQLYFNNGNKTFSSSQLVNQNMNLMPFDAGDADADGDPDLYFAGFVYDFNYSISEVRLNNGAGDLSTGGSSSNHVVVHGGDVAWGDYDHDGYLDLLLAGYDAGFNQARLLRNNGNGTMNGLTNVSVGGFSAGAYDWGDFDNDGRLDYLVTGFTNFSGGAVGLTEVRKNFYGSPNQPPVAPTGLSTSRAIYDVTFSWNAATDDVTPSNGLTYAMRIGKTPGGCEIMSPLAASNGYRRVPQFGNAGQHRMRTIHFKAPGTYFWSVQAIDNSRAGGPFAAEQSFSIPPLPPSVSTFDPLYLSSSQAVVRGAVQTSGTTSHFGIVWGPTTILGNEAGAQQVNLLLGSTSNIIVTITGLVPGVQYYYRAFASNSAGTSTGAMISFRALTTGSRIDVTFSNNSVSGTSLDYSPTESPIQAIDNLLGTSYINTNGPGAGFYVTPSLTNVPVRAIMLASGEGEVPGLPISYQLAGSSDGTNFVVFATNGIPIYSDSFQIFSEALANSALYPYYRVTFPDLVDDEAPMTIGEVELLAHPEIDLAGNVAAIVLPPGATVSFSTNALFDHRLSGANKLEIFGMTDVVQVTITPPSGQTVLKGYELIGADDDITFPERRPSRVALSASDDGINFTFLSIVSPAPVAGHIDIQEFSLSGNARLHANYRLTIYQPTNSTLMQIGELRLFGWNRLPSALDTWRLANFDTTNNTGNAANGADPEGDGDRNLLEFASGGDPHYDGDSPLFKIDASNGAARVYYVKDTNAVGTVSWLIESSTNQLTTWTNRAGVTNTVGTNASIRTIRFDPSAPVRSNEYFRLKVSRP